MKKIAYLFSLVTLFYGCGSSGVSEKKGNVSVKGTLTNSANETVTLVDVNSKTFRTLDSAKVDDQGNFLLAAEIPETGVYNIKISDRNFATVILTPNDKAEFKADAKNLGNTYSVTGSEQAKFYFDINTFSKENGYKKQAVKDEVDSLQNYFQGLIAQRKDEKFIDSLNKTIEPLFRNFQDKMKKLMDDGEAYGKKFIDENPKAFASIIALNLINPETDFTYYQKVDEQLGAAYPSSNNLKPFHSWVAEHVDQYTKLGIGTPAPDFTVQDFAGKNISLSSFKGKVVLVDFWASWCGPCRQENPNVVSAYARYKDKGLEIFGVSLDSEKPKWVEAVKKDGLGWKHGSELKGWKSSFVPLYSITGIPFNVLVGKDGMILAKNLRGPQLDKALDDAFAKQ